MDYQAVINSPIGYLGIITNPDYLVAIDFIDDTKTIKAQTAIAKLTVQQLQNYFLNAQHTFSVPISVQGTAHQEKVWDVMSTIPVGETLTYGAIATKIKSGPRAVGSACRTNPIPIIIPCHRVVAANHIGGFSGARANKWLSKKKWLLQHESKMNI